MRKNYKGSRALNERGTFIGLKLEDMIALGVGSVVLNNVMAYWGYDSLALWINLMMAAAYIRVRATSRPKIVRDSIFAFFLFGRMK